MYEKPCNGQLSLTNKQKQFLIITLQKLSKKLQGKSE